MLSNILSKISRKAAATTGIVTVALAGFLFASQAAAVPQPADPPSCSSNGVGISITVFRADGTTNIGPTQRVKDGETIKYRSTLSFLGGTNCAFQGGTWTLTTPDGTVTGLGAVPEIGGAGVSSLDSALVPYVVLHANESASMISATTNYNGFSRDGNDSPASASTGISKTVAHAKISITPNGTNEINHTHTFTGHVDVNPGSGFVNADNGTTIHFTIASGPGSLNPVSGDCVTAGGTGSCTIDLTSAIPGVTIVNASSSISQSGGVAFGTTLPVTTDSTGGSSGPATKTWVDANIQITPASDTDPINDNHVLTGHVNVNTGTGGYVSAPNGTQITFAIVSGPGSFTTTNPCTTAGGTGSCNITLTSPTVGTTVVSASTTVSVGGVSLTRTTGDANVGDSANASKTWVDISLTTTASGTVSVGGNITDTAHLAGGVSPTGSITFDVYGPGDTTCLTSLGTINATAAVTGAGDYTSNTFAANAAGTYRWIAHYVGNNPSRNTVCNDANESVVVTPKTPSIATLLSTSTTNINTNVHDSATLTGATATAGGTVKYSAYAGANTCSGTDLLNSTVNVTNGIVPDSANIQFASAGTYSFQATYSGDGNNTGPVSSDCTTEQLVVNSFTATMVTTIHGSNGTAHNPVTSVAVGSSVHDSAQLTFGGPAPTGNVVFTFYNGSTCNEDISAGNAGSVAIDGTGLADPSTVKGPLSAGSYSFRATWAGDANYPNGAIALCEPLTVTQAHPTLGTVPSAGGDVGVVLNDTATLSGASSPTGNIDFKLFDPSDASCSGAGVYSQSVALTGNSAATSPGYTSLVAGTYRWTANYIGDANNAAASSGCTAEPVVVTQPNLGYCSPGYWKQDQHFDSWKGYAPTDSFFTVFGVHITISWSLKGKPAPVTDPTLLQALSANGGGINALARAAVDALLNASAGINSGLTTAQVIDATKAAVNSGNYTVPANFTAPENCPLN